MRDGPSPATPSPNPPTAELQGSVPTWWPVAAPHLLPEGSRFPTPPWAVQGTALTHNVWVKRVWLHRDRGREQHGRCEMNSLGEIFYGFSQKIARRKEGKCLKARVKGERRQVERTHSLDAAHRAGGCC